MRFIDSNILAYAFYENEFQENSRNIIRAGGMTDALCLVEAFNCSYESRQKKYY